MLTIGSYIGGKYKVLEVLGKGGMSTVYVVLDEELNTRRAMKVAQRKGMKDDNKAIQGLVADKNILTELKHKFLPRIYEVFENENSMMLVMDLIEGKSLEYWVGKHAYSQSDVIKWAKQICEVIGYIHSRNIIYRDLKPANIMLDSDGYSNDITLIDFGTVRHLERIKSTVSLGTIGYAAPEQFIDSEMGQVDVRTDIYTIGATLHHLVTGSDPRLNPSFSPIREFNSDLSEGLEYIISKCLQTDKAERYQTCAELMVDLENYDKLGKTIRKKLRNKINAFAVTVFLAILFAVMSVFGYASAEKKLSDDYNLILQKASNTQLEQDERTKFYLDAIQTKDFVPDAYLGLIEMFLSYDDDTGTLTRDEVSIIRQLENGLDRKGKRGYSVTIYPLASLEQSDRAGYEQVCYEIGIAFWYDYEVVSERHSSAINWLEKAKDSYPIAQTYIDIGKFEREIKKYEGQGRTVQLYEAYQNFWDMLVKLKSDSVELNDNDMKLLVWREIVNSVSENASYFLARVEKDDMLSLLDAIVADAMKLKNDTTLDAIKKIIGTDPAEFSGNPDENKGSLMSDIYETKAKINSVKD